MSDSDNRLALVRAVRGPVLLIALGMLFLIHQNHPDMYAFHRTWPALIIVLGLMKLLERAVARPAQPPEGPGGKQS